MKGTPLATVDSLSVSSPPTCRAHSPSPISPSNEAIDTSMPTAKEMNTTDHQ